MRGLISFCLALFGRHSRPRRSSRRIDSRHRHWRRSRSSRWFEQRRRTDAAIALSAGISAAFSAPFAAILVLIEFRIGGRTLYAAIGSITAFLCTQLFSGITHAHDFEIAGVLYGFHFALWREWISILVITVFAGVGGAGVIRFIRYSQESLLDLLQTQAWMRTLAGGILLFMVIYVYKAGHAPSWSLMESVLWSRKSVPEVGLLFVPSF